MKPFVELCVDNSLKSICITYDILIDALNNVENLNSDEIDNLLLIKEKI